MKPNNVQTTKRYELSGDALYYTEYDSGVCITAYEGGTMQLAIPPDIDDRPVIAIGKKAFWNNRYLQSIALPDTIETVGDWAFSRCYALESVNMPGREIVLGNHVFQKSAKLQEIYFPGAAKTLAALLAVAVTGLEAEYLLNPAQVGSSDWYKSLDARIFTVLEEPEESALKELVYCAEEDMGAKQEACLKELAYKKAGIAFTRLAHDEGITPVMHQKLAAYLKHRTKGCRDESAWEAVKGSPSRQLQYCGILYGIGGIHDQNIDKVLDDLGEGNIELKAYILKRWQERQRTVDLWEQLKL